MSGVYCNDCGYDRTNGDCECTESGGSIARAVRHNEEMKKLDSILNTLIRLEEKIDKGFRSIPEVIRNDLQT